ncbi:MAG: hypothetical protein J7L14_01050, partial [Candidatus Diapherotrites archaeon]|nr:hypothetical protein [Candidatus Diapherotrites archaeon]
SDRSYNYSDLLEEISSRGFRFAARININASGEYRELCVQRISQDLALAIARRFPKKKIGINLLRVGIPSSIGDRPSRMPKAIREDWTERLRHVKRRKRPK